MDIKNEIITVKTAKLAKEKGYNVGSNGYYCEYLIDQIDPSYPDGGGAFSMTKGEIEYGSEFFINNYDGVDFSNNNYTMYAAPTQSLLARWLREIHNIQVYVNSQTKDGNGKYRDYVVYVNGNLINDSTNNEHQTYEKAFELGLQVALNLI